MAETKTMNATELAQALDTDNKTVRRFLRSVLPSDAQPGRGGRYAIDSKALPALKEKFATWGKGAARVITVDDLVKSED